MEDKQGAYGVSFCGLLTILFIALKLTKVITWSWIWVLAPAWIPLVISLVALVIAVIVYYRKNY